MNIIEHLQPEFIPIFTLLGVCSNSERKHMATTETKNHLDLLRVSTCTEPFDKDPVLREELRTLIVGSIAKMSNGCLQAVARFIDIQQNDRGCMSPAEDFITYLVMSHFTQRNVGLTPKDVEDRLKQFHEDFTFAFDITRRFNRTYSALVNENEQE